ncbi:MAG: UDP-N-acetylmuramate dehydrogenase, partial [Bacteroides sp.]
GAENLSLIPGEVGASAVQNIGAYGAEAKDIISLVETVEIASLENKTFTNADCHFSYRQSIFKNELKGKQVVTFVTYRLNKQASFQIEYGNIKAELENYQEINLSTIRQAIISIRESKLPDPKVEGNAGSFFMNPIIPRSQFEDLQREYATIPHYDVDNEHVKVPAAWMIDNCGWKGRRLGNAGVHDKQALVLVNKGGATGADIIRLSTAVQASVKEKFGINIYPEVNFIR